MRRKKRDLSKYAQWSYSYESHARATERYEDLFASRPEGTMTVYLTDDDTGEVVPVFVAYDYRPKINVVTVELKYDHRPFRLSSRKEIDEYMEKI